MGSLSYGELAGQRMKLGLLLHDPEEEHDCFSDNTHNSHYYDAMGIRAVYLGDLRASRRHRWRVQPSGLGARQVNLSRPHARERSTRPSSAVEAIRTRAETASTTTR